MLAQTAQVVNDWTEIVMLIVCQFEFMLKIMNESRQAVDGEGQCPGEHPTRLRGTNQAEVSRFNQPFSCRAPMMV